jgi:hypothetical protein
LPRPSAGVSGYGRRKGRWLDQGRHVRRESTKPGAKTRGQLIIFETLVAVEESNKKDGLADGQYVKKIADGATAGTTEQKPGVLPHKLKKTTAISDGWTVCSGFSSIRLG